MLQARQIGQIAIITVGVVWLPWVARLAIDIYLLGHHDPKLGRDAGFTLGVALTGAAAAVSAIVAAGAHAIEMRLGRPLSWHARRGAAVLSGLVLGAVGAAAPLAGFRGLLGGVRFPIPWAVLSVVCITTFLGAERWRTAK